MTLGAINDDPKGATGMALAAFLLRHRLIPSVRAKESMMEQTPKRRSALKTVQKPGFMAILEAPAQEPGAEAPPGY